MELGATDGGLYVKASSIGREYSRGWREERFGAVLAHTHSNFIEHTFGGNPPAGLGSRSATRKVQLSVVPVGGARSRSSRLSRHHLQSGWQARVPSFARPARGSARRPTTTRPGGDSDRCSLSTMGTPTGLLQENWDATPSLGNDLHHPTRKRQMDQG